MFDSCFGGRLRVKMGTELADAALDRLGSGTAVWCGWVTRSQPPLPPAAFEKLVPSLIKDDGETCVFASGCSNGQLVAGVWPKRKLPSLERLKSKHVYCVASAPVVDVTLALRQDEPQLHPGAIRCSAIRTRTATELAELRDGAYPGIRKATVVSKPNQLIKSEPNLNSTKTDVKPKNGIAGMFAKQASAPIVKPIQSKSSPEDIKVEKKTEHSIKISEKVEKPPKKVAEVDEKPNHLLQKRTKTVDKKKSKNIKKRKRIEVIDSDDSENSDRDIFENDEKEVHAMEVNFEEEEEIPPTPEVPKRKALPAIHPQKRKRDKTFMGDDGYFHTVKNVLCSDEEIDGDDQKENNVKENVEIVEEIPNTPDISEEKTKSKIVTKTKSKSNKKASPPSQGKQSNIMNFFKKK